jgi:hypothetical protein
MLTAFENFVGSIVYWGNAIDEYFYVLTIQVVRHEDLFFWGVVEVLRRLYETEKHKT